MQTFLRTVWNDDAGQEVVEYMIIVPVICLAVVTSLIVFGINVSNLFTGGNKKTRAEPAHPVQKAEASPESAHFTRAA